MECPFSNKLEDTLNQGEFSGLAIVITNDYQDTKHYSHLTGTSKDGEQLSAAFRHMNFCVRHYTNVHFSSLQCIIEEIRSLRWDTVKNYSCVAILFAGHGTLSDELVLQDGSLVNPLDIVHQLLPGSCPHLGDVPKAFLIDACRGSNVTKTVPVPRGNDTSSRGGTLLDQWLVPEEGNFLIARSTLPKCKAYESGEIGGIWFHTLASYMLNMEQVMSLDDILTEVNGCIVKKQRSPSQQPEKISTLNKRVCLKPSNLISYCSLLGSYLAHNNAVAQYEARPHVVDMNTYYQGVVMLMFHDPQQQEIRQQYETCECYLAFNQAIEEAAKIAYTSLADLSQLTGDRQCESIPNNGATQSCLATSTISPASIPNSSDCSSNNSSCETATSASPCTPKSSNPATKPALNYRSMFHEYCQKEGIDPQYEYDESSSVSKRFKCTISFKKNKRTFKEDSQGFYPKKEEAKEAACYKMLQFKSRGGTEEPVSWKSKLKEYYDKKGEPNKELNYHTTQVDASNPPQFISSIYIRELQRHVHGIVCKSKKEAEQSVAQKVLAEVCPHQWYNT